MLRREECRPIVRQLWPYLDGTAPDGLQDRITSHLAWCNTCRPHFEFASSLLDAIHRYGGAGDTVDRAGLRTRVLKALAMANDGGP